MEISLNASGRYDICHIPDTIPDKQYGGIYGYCWLAGWILEFLGYSFAIKSDDGTLWLDRSSAVCWINRRGIDLAENASTASILQKIDMAVAQALFPAPANAARILQNAIAGRDAEAQSHAFEMAVRPLYRDCPMKIPEKEILVTGQIATDGLGDLFLSFRLIEQLKKDYPDLKIHYTCVLLDSDTRRSKIEEILKGFTQCSSEIRTFEEASEYAKEMILAKHPFVFEVSYPITPGKKSLQAAYGDSHAFIHEYDVSGSGIHPGFEKDAEGIFLGEKPSEALEVDDEQLKLLISKDHSRYFAYMSKNPFDQLLYLYSVACAEAKSEKPIDIFMPYKNAHALDENFFAELGVGCVKIVRKEAGAWEEIVLFNRGEGKELRLINLFPLSARNFQALLSRCNPMKGCTGDQSLAECIALEDVIPYHEKIAHKLRFSRAYMQFVQETLPEHSPFRQFLELSFPIGGDIASVLDCPDRVYPYFTNIRPKMLETARKIGQLMHDSTMLTEAQEVHKKMKQERSFNRVPGDILARNLALKAFPELMLAELRLRRELALGEKNLSQVLIDLKSQLQNLKT